MTVFRLGILFLVFCLALVVAGAFVAVNEYAARSPAVLNGGLGGGK